MTETVPQTASSASPSSPTATAPARPAWRMRRRTRRVALIAHILAAGTWLGLDVAMGVLVFTALAAGEETRAVALQAIELVAVGPMLVAGVVCLASGIVLGLGTNWGLVRYWWVAVKLVVNVVLLVLVLTLLHPGAAEVAETGRALAAGTVDPGVDTGPGDMVFPPIVSTLAVSFAITISVLKPWGRLPGRRRSASR